MIRKISSLLLLAMLFSACGSNRTAQSGAYKPKAFVTPYEYFSHTRPAVFTEKDEVKIRKTATQNIGEDTKEDHTQAIIIGTLVGVSVIGGTVAGILLAR
ncbi:MAG: hypothetical protein IT572_00070 [Deltaproteobacteria bacterium]|nr:hypothetical protein [Deltaproteobacteria bacterium]